MPTLLKKFLAVIHGLSLFRAAAGSLGLKMTAAGLGFINSIILARLLGPAEFGSYSIIFSIVNLAAAIAMLGLPKLTTRETATFAEHGQWSELKGKLQSAHGWVMATALLIGVVSFLFLSVGFFKHEVSWIGIAMAMGIFPLLALIQLRASILRGLHWIILADIPELLLRPAAVFLLLVVAFQSSVRINTVNALGMQFAAIVFSLITVSWLLKAKQPEQLKFAIPTPPPRLWIMACMPFLSITLIGLLEAQAPLYLLGYLGGAEQAGLYQAANQLVGIVAIGLVSVNMPLQPKLSTAWARSDMGQAQRLVTETARMAAGIGMIGVLLLLVFAEAILRLYGQQYIEASQALRILAIGQLVNALSGSCGIVLLMTGHQRIVVQGLAAALLLNFGVAYWAIPAFGMSGAALAVTVGIVFWNIYYVFSALNILGLNTTVFPIKNMANVRKS